MAAIAFFLDSIGIVLDWVLYFFLIVVSLRVIVSWVNADPFNPFVRFLTAATEPLLQPLRKYIRPIGGVLDLSPLILALLLLFLSAWIPRTIRYYAAVLGQ